ncbi:MAG: peptidoglycan DD-metalloendopeptidase family protein [Thermomicrobiales bacterium]|nr:peptidoglycan DD-metalloendopeptidase family protein [Thermomicrobiales bacterium]
MANPRTRSAWKARTFPVFATLALLFSLAATPLTAGAEFDVSVGSVNDLSGLTAVAAGNGQGVNVRVNPALGADVLATIPDGTVVALRIDRADTVRAEGIRWWPVTVNGNDGWIAGPYLADSNGASPDRGTETSPGAGRFAIGSYVRANTDDGATVNIRTKPNLSGDVVGHIVDGGVVQVMDGPYEDRRGIVWFKVTDGGTTGWSSAEWLAQATGPSAPADAQGEFAEGDWVRVSTNNGDNLNMRHSARVRGGLVDTVAHGAKLLVLEGPRFDDDGNAWYKVEHFNNRGWVIGDWIESSSRPAYSDQYRSFSGGTDDRAVSTASTAGAAGVATGSMRLPLDNYVVTQEFGCSYLGYYSYNSAWGCPVHDGLDLAAPLWTELKASDGGTVTAAGWCDCGLGYYVQIDHGNGISTIYGHMVDQPPVSAGQQVGKGQVIGYIGSTGTSTGPHVHFMMLVNGNAVNPREYAG